MLIRENLNEVLMLMQYVFLLEQQLKRSGQANTDLTQRVLSQDWERNSLSF